MQPEARLAQSKLAASAETRRVEEALRHSRFPGTSTTQSLLVHTKTVALKRAKPHASPGELTAATSTPRSSETVAGVIVVSFGLLMTRAA